MLQKNKSLKNKNNQLLEEKVDISDISWNHQKLLKVGGDYIHKTRDGKLWYEIEDDIKNEYITAEQAKKYYNFEVN